MRTTNMSKEFELANGIQVEAGIQVTWSMEDNGCGTYELIIDNYSVYSTEVLFGDDLSWEDHNEIDGLTEQYLKTLRESDLEDNGIDAEEDSSFFGNFT